MLRNHIISFCFPPRQFSLERTTNVIVLFLFVIVSVAPSVQVPSQLLGAPLGSEVQLECLVEASPAPVSYWMKGGKSPTNLEAGQPRSEMLLDG